MQDSNDTANILIVDDSPSALQLLTLIVSKQYRVRTASEGESAIASTRADPPDLILLDIMMPEMDGYQVCEKLKADADTRDIPVIFISALDATEAKVRAFDAGGVDYVTKPLQAQEVMARIRIHLALRSLNKSLEENNAQLEREIAIRQRAEETQRNYAEQLRILNAIDQSILAAQSPESIAVTAVGRICRLMACQRVTVIEITESDQLKQLAAESNQPLGLREDIDIYRHAFEGQLFQDGRVQGVADLESLSRLSPMQEALYGEGVRSFVILPLRARAQLIGSLHLESDRPHAFGPEQISAAIEIAALMAMAIQQTRLYAAVHQRTLELEARNAELDAFAHTVAHDLRNPLTTLIGVSDVLAARATEIAPDRLKRHLSAVGETARKMNSIIDELLLLTSVRGIDSVETQPLDMPHLIGEAQKRIAHMIDEYQPEIVMPDRWPTAWGYAPWVEEVWVNYFSNALKYGGQPPCVEFGATELDSDQIMFWVHDNGPGLSPEQQALLFTPFERLHQTRATGYGLGLSIVQRIVEKLGGQVGLESQGVPGQGCRFHFTLPAQPRK